MEQILAIGMEEGLTEAIGQIDAILSVEPLRQASARRTDRRRRG